MLIEAMLFSKDWITGSQVAVAGTTLVLALVAYRTARSASKTAEAAEAQVEAERMPLLIDVLPQRRAPPQRISGVPLSQPEETVSFDDGHVVDLCLSDSVIVRSAKDRGYLSVPLRNVGRGLADIRGIELLIGRGGFAGTTRKPNLPPGESTRFNFIIRPDDPMVDWPNFPVPKEPEWASEVPWDTDRIIALQVSYTDLAGGQPTKTRVEVTGNTDLSEWAVHRVQHLLGDEALPLFDVDPMNLRC